MQVFCSLRIRLRPLVPMVPIIAGVSISFMGPPTLDAAIAVSLSPLLPPLNLCNIPGFRTLKVNGLQG
jgi:Ca2+-dependent lipid-binding protein